MTQPDEAAEMPTDDTAELRKQIDKQVTEAYAQEKLTHEIYKAMQVLYLSERHDAIKNLIKKAQARSRQQLIEQIREAIPVSRKEFNTHEDVLMNGGFNKAITDMDAVLTKLEKGME